MAGLMSVLHTIHSPSFLYIGQKRIAQIRPSPNYTRIPRITPNDQKQEKNKADPKATDLPTRPELFLRPPRDPPYSHSTTPVHHHPVPDPHPATISLRRIHHAPD